jgi:DNA-binding CsgD family transcriptional regulator
MSEIVPDETLRVTEVEILQLLADGSSLEKAAETIGLAEQTVKGYVYIMRQKLGAETTTNAIAIALRRGIID